MAEQASGLLYKGHPLRRVGNLVYYGSMADPFIVVMQVRESAPQQNLEVATKVSIELQRTDSACRGRDRIVKKGEKESLATAMEFAVIWLERALSGK